MYRRVVRLPLSLVGLFAGLAFVAAAIRQESLLFVGFATVLIVPALAALKVELAGGQYSAVVRVAADGLHDLARRFRRRAGMAVVGGVLGPIASGVLYWDPVVPLGCQDMFLPDPPLCGFLFAVRKATPWVLLAVGCLFGWSNGHRPVSVLRQASETLGQIVAMAGISHAIRVAAVAGFAPWDSDPWMAVWMAILVSGGVVMYVRDIRRRSTSTGTATRFVGWLAFAIVLVIPPEGDRALLAVAALAAVPEWGRSKSAQTHIGSSASDRATRSRRSRFLP